MVLGLTGNDLAQSFSLCCGDKPGRSSAEGDWGRWSEGGRRGDDGLTVHWVQDGKGVVLSKENKHGGGGGLLPTEPLNLRVTEGGIPCCSCPRRTDLMPFLGTGKKALCDPPGSPQQGITANRYVLTYLPYLNRQIKHCHTLVEYIPFPGSRDLHEL